MTFNPKQYRRFSKKTRFLSSNTSAMISPIIKAKNSSHQRYASKSPNLLQITKMKFYLRFQKINLESKNE